MNTEQETRRGKIFIYITIIMLFVAIVVGITYAFFAGGVTNTGNVSVDVTTSDQVSITYTTGKDLELDATEPGMSEEGYFDITVSGGSGVTTVYNVILNITSNSFVHDQTAGHTTDSEITYSFYYSTDSGNNKTWTAITENADLTAVTGNVNLATNEILTSSSSDVTKYYKLVINYPNLPKDQSYNMNKSLTGTISFEDAN